MLVIWIHTFNLGVYGIAEEAEGLGKIVYCIEMYWSKITQIAVPMFFFVSGFLFFRTFSTEKIFNKYISRIKSILVPYLCWCTLYYLYFVVISGIPFLRNMISENDVVNLSFKSWIDALWIDSYYTLWFFKHLIIFIIIAPILYFFIKNRKYIPIGSLTLIIIILNNFMGWINVLDGFEMFVFGGWIASNYREKVFLRNKILTYISYIYIYYV